MRNYTKGVICAVASVLSNSLWLDPIDSSLLGVSVHGDSSGKNTDVSCHALLQGIFLTWEPSSPAAPALRWILYHWVTREAYTEGLHHPNLPELMEVLKWQITKLSTTLEVCKIKPKVNLLCYKVLVWKTQQWTHDWIRSAFIPIPK